MTAVPKPNPFVDGSAMTLADVYDKVETSPGLSEREQRECRSALKTASKWFDRPLEHLPASLDYLRRKFERFHHEQANVTLARVRNVRSLIKKAFAAAEIPVMRHYMAPMTPVWEQLWDIMEDQYERASLSRLFHYCSAQQVQPDDINEEVSATFLNALVEEDLTSKPKTTHQTTCRIWMRCKDKYPDWPQISLQVPTYQEMFSLPWDTLEESFLGEVESFLDRLALEGGLLDENGPPRALSQSTIKKYEHQIRMAATALVRAGIPSDQIVSLSDLVTLANFKRILGVFLDRNGGQTSCSICEMACALKTIAKYHSEVPSGELDALAAICKKLTVTSEGMTEKNAIRLSQLDDPFTRYKFLNHSVNRFAKLERVAKLSRKIALEASICLAMEILIHAPMRISNLAGLDMENHVHLPSAGRPGDTHLTVPKLNVKNRVLVEHHLPEHVTTMIRTYIRIFRPLLTTSTSSTALFPNHKGAAKRSDSMSKQLGAYIWKELGIKWNAHIFRHFAACLIIDERPGDYEGPRRLLHHQDANTTYNTYQGRETRSATKALNDIIIRQRQAVGR